VLSLLAFALQLAAATTPSPPLAVRVGERVRNVGTVTTRAGVRALRADQLMAALGGLYADHGDRRVELVWRDLRVELLEGVAVVVSGRDTLSMSSATSRIDGLLFLPVSFATQLLPRLSSKLRYDATARELHAAAVERPRGASATTPAVNASSGRATSENAASAGAARRRIVVVDAGHGGPDNGMSGPIGAQRKVREKDITLEVARALKAALEQRGITVIMTRTKDTLIALSDRGKIANHAKGDLFLSVHVNAANPRWRDPGAARGYETYFLAEAKTEDEKRVEAMENEAIRFETSADATRDDPLGFIIRDMAQNEHLRESARLAELMQLGLRKVHPGTDRGVKQAGFRVLVTAFMPAVLVEIGFGSNRGDSDFMTDPDRQRALASTLADAAVSYLDQYERKVGGTP